MGTTDALVGVMKKEEKEASGEATNRTGPPYLNECTAELPKEIYTAPKSGQQKKVKRFVN